ncbi:MarR family transcriptional regulator [Sphingomonas sp. ASV193]|uniref:MarR family winged helix-turn-helix transcriptional regulator n=1 Tax=Sphingomonas sp. ASV193 TaxID=3144405 RepID=UPI0032E8D9E3
MRELAWNISETAHALRRLYGRRAQEHGITRAQWGVLKNLALSPGLKQVELAERLDVEPITLCRMVDRMEESGLVARQRDPADRRAWRLALTDKAQPLLAELRAMSEGLAEAAFDGLTGEEVTQLQAMLARIRANVAGIEESGRKSA